ncbi:MAG: hypothetical protein IH972_02685 [Candidatus Marinimicrobia bacterium]|nr:hypothetical protein [Candidatus Neomarinimicrobiota bacterium]
MRKFINQHSFVFLAGLTLVGTGSWIAARGVTPGGMALFGVLLASFLTAYIRAKVTGAHFEDQTDWKQVFVGKRMPALVKLYSNY